jgi:hypothetical protein
MESFFDSKEYEVLRRSKMNNEKEEKPSVKLFHPPFADTPSKPGAKPGEEMRVSAWWGEIRKRLGIEDEEISYLNYAGHLGGTIYEDDEDIVEKVHLFHCGNKRFTRWTKPLEIEENPSGDGVSRKQWN